MAKLDRRSFIKASAVASAAVSAISLAGCEDNELQETEPEGVEPGQEFAENEENAEWIAAPCWHNCGGRCLNKVLVKDGTILRQKTDDTHEDSWDHPQSRGCIRGRATQQQVFGPDRLKYPMKRKNWSPDKPNGHLRGIDEWERISWDEALDYMANEIKKAKENYGNESILYMNIINLEGYLGGVLSAYGGYVDTVGTDSVGTFGLTANSIGVPIGELNDRYDILNSDYVILWGNNAAWCSFGNPSYYLKKYKQEGINFIYVGPDYPATAGFLDAKWIPVRPATDTALLLAIAHSMITRDEEGSLIDWEFLNSCTVGFDSEHMPDAAVSDENFYDYVMGKYDGIEKTPEWASEICGTTVEEIEYLADVLGCDNNCYISSNGAPARNKGAENFPQAFMTVAAMGGHFGKPGNACGDDQYYSAFNRGPKLVNPAPGGIPFQFTNAQNPVDNVLSADNVWDAILNGKYIDSGSHNSGTTRKHEERQIDIHVIISEQHNRLQTFQGTKKGIEAFRKVDFVSAQAYTMKTDSRYADIVLPICTRWEYYSPCFYDMFIDKENCFSHGKVIDPLFECKTDWDIANEISNRLGIDFSEVVPFTEKQMWYNAMANTTIMNDHGEYEPLLTITQETIDKYEVQGEPQQGQVDFEKFLEDGVYRVKRSADDPFVYISFEQFRKDPDANPIDTESGKLEIHCAAKAKFFDLINDPEAGHVTPGPLPIYLDQNEGYVDSFTDWEKKERGPYPFQMSHLHYLRRAHSDYDNLPWLREVMVNPVFVNKDDATKKGIKNGDVILVYNDNGSFIRPATLSRCIMPGVIMVPHGAGVHVDEETGIDLAGADNYLTTHGNSTSQPLSGWNTTLVDYKKYDGDLELLPDYEWPLDIPIKE